MLHLFIDDSSILIIYKALPPRWMTNKQQDTLKLWRPIQHKSKFHEYTYQIQAQNPLISFIFHPFMSDAISIRLVSYFHNVDAAESNLTSRGANSVSVFARRPNLQSPWVYSQKIKRKYTQAISLTAALSFVLYKPWSCGHCWVRNVPS